MSNRKEQRDVRRNLRLNATPSEAALWRILKGNQIEGLRWRRQFSVGPYIGDFYCPRLRLCIELDGEQHYTVEGVDHDDNRTEWLWREKGIRVVRIENKDVFIQYERITEYIRNIAKEMLMLSTPPSASLPPPL